MVEYIDALELLASLASMSCPVEACFDDLPS